MVARVFESLSLFIFFIMLPLTLYSKAFNNSINNERWLMTVRYFKRRTVMEQEPLSMYKLTLKDCYYERA